MMKRVSAPGAPSIDCLPVLVQTRWITACKCISKLARSQPPSVSPNSLDHSLHVYLETRSIRASKCISKFAWLRHPSSLDDGLQVDLHIRSITASKCISKLARSQPSSLSLNSPDYGLQVHLQSRSITASNRISKVAQSRPPKCISKIAGLCPPKCISKPARSRSPSVSLSSLDRHFQAHLELLPITACSQSRYSVCRWVAI